MLKQSNSRLQIVKCLIEKMNVNHVTPQGPRFRILSGHCILTIIRRLHPVDAGREQLRAGDLSVDSGHGRIRERKCSGRGGKVLKLVCSWKRPGEFIIQDCCGLLLSRGAFEDRESDTLAPQVQLPSPYELKRPGLHKLTCVLLTWDMRRPGTIASLTSHALS